MKFLRFFKFLWRAQWLWGAPSTSRILIFDRTGSELIRSLLTMDDIQTLDTRGESINLPILLRSLRRSGGMLKNYFLAYIRCVKPRLVITYIDNNLQFYTLKSALPEIRFAFIQNGVRGGGGDVFAQMDHAGITEAGSVDLMFVYGKAVGREYAKYINGECIPIGSVRANHFAQKAKKSSKFSRPKIGFISQYHSEKTLVLADGIASAADFFQKPDDAVFEFLRDWLPANSAQLTIISRNNWDTLERKYFERIAGIKIQVAERTADTTSYALLNTCSLIVTIDSSLGYEALALGHRVAFFAVRGTVMNDPSLNFGWPAKLPQSGPFWTNHLDATEFKRILNFCQQATADKWKIATERYLREVIVYDKNNQTLRSRLAAFA